MTTIGKIHHILNDSETGQSKVAVYLRERKRRNLYYARFAIEKRHLANNQRYVVESLRTDNLDIAIDKARSRYAVLCAMQSHGTVVKDFTVAEALDRFLSHYEENLKTGITGFSVHMLRGFRKSIDIYWREFVGKKSLNSVAVTDFEDYEFRRKNWAKNTKRDKKLHGNYKTDIAPQTIKWEINAFKQFLRWCSQRNMYSGRAYEWVFKAGKRNRRSAFTLSQYRELHRYMHSDEFLKVGKHGTDKRIRRHRVMLRTYILFMVNTGLRVGEARHLKWSGVTPNTNKLGQAVITIRISKKHTKVKERRLVVGRHYALRALESWKRYFSDIGEGFDAALFWKGDADRDRLIFCNSSGTAIQDFREGFNSIIREAGVEFDADGEKLTCYSMRHTYITFRLQYGKSLSIYKLAKNCGTSVSMIEGYYDDTTPEDFVDELTIGDF